MHIKKVKIGKGVHLLIKVMINRKPARFLIDTGASRTILSAEHYQQYADVNDTIKRADNIAVVGGTELANEIQLSKLQIESLIWKDYKFLVMSMKSINEQYASFNLKAVHGILGSDLLTEGQALLDFKEEQLKFQI